MTHPRQMLYVEIVTLEVPAVVGVPEMTPEVVLMLNPAGRPVAPKEVGLSLAVTV